MSVHQNLKRRRKEHRLTQEEVASKLGISRQSISKWENGNSYPDIDNLILLSELYGVSVDNLLHGNNINAKKSKNNFSVLLIVSVIATILPPLGGIISVIIFKKINNIKVKHKKIIVFLCKISVFLSVITGIIGINFLLYWHN